ncbi:INO80 complex subunit B [Biomphalaria glabrata]|nr:INO80 complex subunit B [Biomphalaria glabrata]
MDFEDDIINEPPAKKHKKHKKKHKHKKEPAPPALMSPKTSIKLKLKLGKETMGTKNVMSVVQSTESHVPELSKAAKKSAHNDEEDFSDDDKWLEALEKGYSNNYADIAKKDPALLTARQKALLHGSQQDELLQLPSGYKTVELTDEQKRRRQEKAKRRRQQANEKMENDKNQTVHKLLKKQDSKLKRPIKPRGGKSSSVPRIIYRNRLDDICILLPPDVPFPLRPELAKSYPEPQLCGVDGCTNMRTSICSKTKVPICSLACYKKNLKAFEALNSEKLSEDIYCDSADMMAMSEVVVE